MRKKDVFLLSFVFFVKISYKENSFFFSTRKLKRATGLYTPGKTGNFQRANGFFPPYAMPTRVPMVIINITLLCINRVFFQQLKWRLGQMTFLRCVINKQWLLVVRTVSNTTYLVSKIIHISNTPLPESSDRIVCRVRTICNVFEMNQTIC